MQEVHIVGGGLAGSEAAWQCLNQGFKVIMHEMRPKIMTAAHKSGDLAELVCSNTFKSKLPDSAPGQLKAEMRQLDSLVIRSAEASAVPSGQALGVDRTLFSTLVTDALRSHPNYTRIDEEVTDISAARRGDATWIIATGPLTSPALAEALQVFCGSESRLFFYDAIAPIIASDSIDFDACFRANRYDETSTDYVNIPLTKDEYYTFVDGIIAAEKMPLHDFESTQYFEACLPIEVMADRGRETLRFGPMKPVGLTDPKTGRWPYAAIQLRMENAEGTMLSMVGFQTKMKWPEQERIFRSLPALREAEFLRLGSVHRNTYIESPKVLNSDLSFKTAPNLYLAGQVTGVEGYTESAAIGLLAARAACEKLKGRSYVPPPKTTMLGALCHYVTHGGMGAFQPMNANLGLLPSIERKRGVSKADKKKLQCQLASEAFRSYLGEARI